MSSQNTKSNQSDNIFSTYKQNVQKYFESVSKTTPQYFQSIAHLQDECVKACQKTIDASVSLNQEMAKKSGFSAEIPEAANNVLVDTNKQVVQAITVQNQVIKTSIDATVQNIKTFNDNVNSFVDLNKNIVQSWINPFTLQKN